MKLFDRLCAGVLFILAIVDGLLVPKNYTGRIWIFGTCLALLFTAMLNGLRIRNGPGVKGLKLFCITANVDHAGTRSRADRQHRKRYERCSIHKSR